MAVGAEQREMVELRRGFMQTPILYILCLPHSFFIFLFFFYLFFFYFFFKILLCCVVLCLAEYQNFTFLNYQILLLLLFELLLNTSFILHNSFILLYYIKMSEDYSFTKLSMLLNILN